MPFKSRKRFQLAVTFLCFSSLLCPSYALAADLQATPTVGNVSAVAAPRAEFTEPVLKPAVPTTDAVKPLVLSGSASRTAVQNELHKVVSDLVAESLNSNSEYIELQVAKGKKHPFRAIAHHTETILGEVVEFNATSASKDGAKIALDEVSDWDEKDALILRQQKLADDLHPRIAAAVLQVAMGRGAVQQTLRSQQATERGFAELESLVSGQTRDSVDESMNRWLSEEAGGEIDELKSSDMLSNRNYLTLLTEAAVRDDETTNKIRKELRHFAKPHKGKDIVCNALRMALDTTAYTMPTGFTAAAVEAVKGVLVASTGGPEDDKLQHILFLLKRVESRKNSLKEEIQEALYGREVGVQTNNKLLVKCADALIASLVNPETVVKIEQDEAAALKKRMDDIIAKKDGAEQDKAKQKPNDSKIGADPSNEPAQRVIVDETAMEGPLEENDN